MPSDHFFALFLYLADAHAVKSRGSFGVQHRGACWSYLVAARKAVLSVGSGQNGDVSALVGAWHAQPN